MKILHTADWHIGCKTDGFCHFKEQIETCKKIVEIANEENVEMVIIAGDLYDSLLPDVETEDLIFDTLYKLSNFGERPVIVCAGNHDDPIRFERLNQVSKLHNVYLVGYENKIEFENLEDKNIYPVKTEKGSITFKNKNGEKIVVASIPYPDYYQLKNLYYSDKKIDDCVDIVTPLNNFEKDAINIAVGHFLTYPIDCTKKEFESFSKVGTIISYLDREKIVSKANYTALGHVHQIVCVDKPHSIYYSGATVNKFFLDEPIENGVLIVDVEKDGTKNVKTVPITILQALYKDVENLDEAKEFCEQHKTDLLKLNFIHNMITPNKANSLRKQYPNIQTIKCENLKQENEVNVENVMPKTKELLDEFLKKNNIDGNEKLDELFLQLISEATYEN